jgi:hypothetical protein
MFFKFKIFDAASSDGIVGMARQFSNHFLQDLKKLTG